MATRYTRSTDGSDADGGTTWALAKATLAGVSAIDTVGDILFVSQSHAESTAGAVSIALAGTIASPTRLLCGNDAAEPPTALATTASVVTTGNNAITVSGNAYMYGITFSSGDGANNVAGNFNTGGGTVQIYESCNFSIVATGGTAATNLGVASAAAGSLTEAVNCGFKFANAGQGVNLGCRVNIRGGSLLSGGTSPTNMFRSTSTRPINAVIDGFDLSNASAGVNLVQATAASGKIVFRNCKLPGSWSGSLWSAAPTTPELRAELYNCDSASTNYRLWVEDFCGSIKQETTIVKSSGATDGDTPISWKMASSANAIYPSQVLRSPEIFSERITTTGSPVTITVDFVHDTNVAAGQGAGTANAFQNDEVWLEVQYLSASGTPLGTFVNNAKADVLATAADLASSSVTWTTTRLTTPVKQKLSVTFTPQQKGVAVATICIGKASKTIYVDPYAQMGSSGTLLSYQVPGAGVINTASAAAGGMIASRIQTGM